MKTFLNERRRSAGYARDRMKLLLISERIECSPQMMKMLKSDLDRKSTRLNSSHSTSSRMPSSA